MSTEVTPRRTPRRRGQGEQLRREIIEAAAAEVARTGDPASLSLRGVARDVGIATTSIYLHFPSLDDLIREVKAKLFAEFSAFMVVKSEAGGEDPVERIRSACHGYVEWAHERPGDYLMMFTAALTPGRKPLEGAVAALELMRTAVLAARGGGEEEAWMLTLQLWTALHGSVLLRVARPHIAWPDEHAQVDDLVTRLFT